MRVVSGWWVQAAGLLLALLARAPALQAADLSWPDTITGDAAPAGFTLASSDPHAALHAEHGTVDLTSDGAQYVLLSATTGGRDGSDDAPLRVSCTLAVDQGHAEEGAPLVLALHWDGGAVLAVGAGDGGGERGGDRWANRAWTLSAGFDGAPIAVTPSGLTGYPGPAPLHVRLVVTSRFVGADASGDGWNWARLMTWPRQGPYAQPPARIVVGRGLLAAGTDGLAHAPPGPKGPCHYRIGALTVASESARVPAELMKSYDKKDSREETLDELAAAGMVRSWQILGPLPPKPEGYGIETLPASAPLPAAIGKLTWKTFTPGDSPADRIMALQVVAPGMGVGALRYAVATITVPEARRERFLFDGERDCTLFLNGQELAQDWHDGTIGEDRLSAVGWLHAGDNRLVVRLGAGQNGRAILELHHEHGDALWRIALLQRLAIDFPDDADAVLQSQEEIAHLWEDLGFQRQAAQAYEDLAHLPEVTAEQADAALTERARLDRELGDDAAVASDIDALVKRWAESSDPARAQVQEARLWQRMGQVDKAAAALEKARRLTTHNPERSLAIARDQAAIHFGLKDMPAVISDLEGAAQALPLQDPRRGELWASIALEQVRLHQPASAALSEALHASATLTLRRISAIAALADQVVLRTQALARLAAMAPSTLDAPRATLGEIAAASGHPADAVAYWQAHVAALPGATDPVIQDRLGHLPASPDGQLQALRGIAIESVLRATDAGKALLQMLEDHGPPPLPAEVPEWYIAAPIPLDNWRPWDPAWLKAQHIDPDHVDIHRPLEGHPWVRMGAEAFQNGILDFENIYHGQNCIAFMAGDVTSNRDIDTELSMGSDDALQVYCNGVQVHVDTDQRGISPDSIKVPVHFHQGVNHLLVMVEQGGGDWAVQLRIIGGVPTASITAALRHALRQDQPRTVTAAALAGVCRQLESDGRYDQASQLARAIFSAYPSQDDGLWGLAWTFETWAREHGDGQLLMDLEDWFEAQPASLLPERIGQVINQEWRVAEQEQSWQRHDRALELLEAMLCRWFESDWQAETWRRRGELERCCGFLKDATDSFTHALAGGVTDAGWLAAVRQGMARSRPPKGRAAVDTGFEVNNLMRSAERAAAAGDAEHAIATFQQGLEEHGDSQCLTPDGQMRSVCAYAGACLRRLDAHGQDLYRTRYEGQARIAYADALAHDDVVACERVAALYPLTETATAALIHAGEAYAARGAWGLAAGTWERVLREQALTAADAARLRLRWVHAAALAHDAPTFARAQAALAGAAAGTVPTGDGGSEPLATWLERQQRLLAPQPVPAVGAVSHATLLASFPVPPEDSYDLARIPWLSGTQPIAEPLVAGSDLLLATLSGTRCLDATTGATRWRDFPAFPELSHPQRWTGFAGIASCRPALVGDVVVARVLRGTNSVLEAHDRTTGALRWSTEATLQGAPGLQVLSNPAAAADRILAVVSAENRIALAAFAVQDGTLLWSSPLSARTPSLTVGGGNDIPLGGYLAAPTIDGRCAYVAPELGVLWCVDLGAGAIQWGAHYPRGQFDAAEGQGPAAILAERQPSPVAVAGDHLLVVPRDSLGVFAFTRDGVPAWNLLAQPVRHLDAVSADGSLALASWLHLTAIDTATGCVRWRFQPTAEEGECHGHALIVGDTVVVSTDTTLVRLDLRTGAVRSRQAWKDLGITGAPPSNVALGPHGLIGVSLGAVVSLCGDQPARAPAVVAGIEQGTAIPTAGLPTSPPGGPLVVQWRIAGDPCRQIDVPAATPEGCCYVRCDHTMALIDVAHHQVRWRVRVSPDTRWAGYTSSLILLVHHGGVVALDRATGAPRWTSVYPPDVLDALRDNGQEVSLDIGEHALVVHRYWSDQIMVLATADGHALGSFPVQGNPLCGAELDGMVWIAVRRGERVAIVGVELARLGVHAVDQPLLDASDQDGAEVCGTAMILHNHFQAVRYDLVHRTTRPFPLVGTWWDLHAEGGVELAYVHGLNDRYLSAVLDPTDEHVRWSELTAGGWPPGPYTPFANHLVGDLLVRAEANHNNHRGWVAHHLDGREAWRIDARDAWAERENGLVSQGTWVTAFSNDMEGRLWYHLIDTRAGSERASGVIPGWWGEGEFPKAVVAGEIVYGTDQGITALVPTTPEAGNALATTGAVPELGALDHLVVLDGPAPAVDGHLDDWAGTDGWAMAPPAAARSGGDGALPQARSGTVRLRWTPDAVYAAVTVTGALHPTIPGSIAGNDHVTLAFDPGLPNWRSYGQVVLTATVRDGVTLLWRNGQFEPPGSGADHCQARAATGPTGITWTFRVPWSVLRGDPNQRPGGYRTLLVDVMAGTPEPGGLPRALEWAWGLAEGWDPTCWQPVQVQTAGELGITGIAFSLHNGGVRWGPAGLISGRDHQEHPFFTDDFPAGAQLAGAEDFTWTTTDPAPGAHRSHSAGARGGDHQHYLTGIGPFIPGRGDRVYAWVWLDPAHPPTEVMLQFNRANSWEHRGYWGQDALAWGAAGSAARRQVGPLPALGRWVRLEIPVEAIDLR